MNSKLSLAALLIAGSLPLAALAANPTPAGGSGADAVPPMFQELDRDKDGQINKEEAKRSADASASFTSIDTDKNGKLSVAEWKAHDKQGATKQ
ncbi:EF-hand domain-containing protein [Denitromonas iodatirespirans]|uniref:EF-hand domain-containing protein n=1 Tax=Denitromonas iodatirespirans TaxID=2795389 RepID=A0A944DGC3_DENI1|nr:EF-hand domain-containing protein [Denitromonas iodatirespirans]MBT0963692.1 EF-hand domain-containing protein [Denitromonas iodatirespirans]